MENSKFIPYRNREYAINLIQTSKHITDDEKHALIQYLDERQATQKFSDGRYWNFVNTFLSIRRTGKVDIPITQMTYPDLINVVGRIKSSKLTPSSQHSYILCILMFYRYLIENNIVSGGDEILKKVNEIKLPVIPQKKVTDSDIYTKDEILTLIRNAGSIKEKAMFGLWYECGLRPSELAGLKWKDIKAGNGGAMVTIRTTKTKYNRTIWVEQFYEYIYQHKNTAAQTKPDDYVFLRRNGTTYTHKSIQMVYDRCCKNAGLRHIPMYHIRHARGTHLVREGMNEVYIKMMLEGHEDSQAIKAYITPDEQMLKTAIQIHNGTITKTENDKPLTQIVCPSCRYINTPDTNYCRNCGLPLTEFAKDRQNILIKYANAAKVKRDNTGTMSDEELIREFTKRFRNRKMQQ